MHFDKSVTVSTTNSIAEALDGKASHRIFS